jgi:hypothetical protein
MDFPANRTGIEIQHFLAVHATVAKVGGLGAAIREARFLAPPQWPLSHAVQIRQNARHRRDTHQLLATFGEQIRQEARRLRGMAARIASLSSAVAARSAVTALLDDPDYRELVAPQLRDVLIRDLVRRGQSETAVASLPDKSSKNGVHLWEQILARMRNDIAEGKTTKEELNALPRKELAHRYSGKRTTVVKALKSVPD